MEWVVATATIVLVVVTGFYAWQTRGIAQETESLARVTAKLATETATMAAATQDLAAQARAARRPVLVAGLWLAARGYGEIRLVNAGGGAGLDVDLRIAAHPGGVVRTWKSSALPVGEIVHFRLVPEDEAIRTVPDFVGKYSAITLQGSYSDAEGEEYEIAQRIEVNDEWSAVTNVGQIAAARMFEDRLVEEIRAVRKAISGERSATAREI